MEVRSERATMADPRATIVVAESDPPLRGIEVRNTVELIKNGALETAVAIATRYIGAEKASAYVGSASGGHLIVRLRPGDLRIWDFSDEHGDERF